MRTPPSSHFFKWNASCLIFASVFHKHVRLQHSLLKLNHRQRHLQFCYYFLPPCKLRKNFPLHNFKGMLICFNGHTLLKYNIQYDEKIFYNSIAKQNH